MQKKLLKLALVGRPNVRKSALFNRICKKRIAIVDEAEGVTRDRLYAEADFFGKPFEVIDTGGIDAITGIPFQEEVKRQAEIAIEEADALVMVVDATVGVTSLDEEVARLLLRTQKRLVLAINKIDSDFQKDLIFPFYSLGISKMVAVSAEQNFQIAELLEQAFRGMEFPEESAKQEGIKVAIVGRPNVGKSTLMNYLLQEERCVVSPIAGTTRDSVDVEIEVDGMAITLIDTAGIRRKKSENDVVDKFAALRTERAIDRADICVLMLEAKEGMTAQEKKIARSIEEQGKGCLLLFNKWDLVKGFRMEHCLKAIREEVPFLNYCPALFISAKHGRNVNELFTHIKQIREQQHRRITTGQLNKFMEKTLQQYHPPMLQGKRLRIYYLAQVDVHPPQFVLFVNHADLMVDTYKKYLINQFRETYGFSGVPIIFNLKGRKTREESDAAVREQIEQETEESFEPEESLEDFEEADQILEEEILDDLELVEE